VITYIPNPGFQGVDSFTYQASDGSEVSNIATVTLSIGEIPLAADLNGDGAVNVLDLLTLKSNYGADNPTPSQGDINRDGHVNRADVALLAMDFGARQEVVSPAPTPATAIDAERPAMPVLVIDEVFATARTSRESSPVQDPTLRSRRTNGETPTSPRNRQETSETPVTPERISRTRLLASRQSAARHRLRAPAIDQVFSHGDAGFVETTRAARNQRRRR
jgi:hypothetical protein